MKTNRKIKISLLFVLFTLGLRNANGQAVTSTSGYIPSSTAYYASLPVVTLSQQSAMLTLPNEIDNSIKPYFPQIDNTNQIYIYNQNPTASCQNVATVWNTFTYEINRLRNLTSNQQATRYAPNFTYNHLNHGFQGWEGYTSLEKVQKFLMESGGMTDAIFDGPGQLDPTDSWRWPTGYDVYYNVLTNKLESAQKFDMSIPVGYNGESIIKDRLESNLNTLKYYLYDHNEGDINNGGIITFGVNFETGTVLLPTASAHANENVMFRLNYNDPGGHAMAIVGYSDDVKYDWGGAGTISNPQPDGQFRNDIDNNKDGIIDMQDWEIGAVKVYNSYGYNFDFHGYRWMLYCTLPFKLPDPNQGQWWGGHEYYTIKPKANNKPEVVLKVEIAASKRNDLIFGCGSSPLANSVTYNGSPFYYTGYYNDGGPLTIQGKDKNGNDIQGPLDLLFDYNHFFSGTDYGKVFLVNANNGSSQAQINYFALVDYRWDETFELPYEGLMPFNVLPYGTLQNVGIEYDLIVQGPQAPAIMQSTTFEANMVSRFAPIITNNSTLTINPGVMINMYNSTITIEQGSSLSLGNNVIIRAKRGTNKFVIKGNIISPMGTNVEFEAEPGATLEVIYENSTVAGLLENCIFNNANLTAQGGTLTVKNSTFTLLPSNKVIVKPTAKLILDASLLTKSGASQWQGIEVWGNSYQHQQTVSGQCAQGTIELKNNTIIENAYNGITNWKPNDWNSIGGIIKATGVKLRNNRRSVEFMKYKNFDPSTGQEIDNLSSFYDCTFEVNDQYPAGAAPYYAQVSLWYVKGVKFSGCDFVNNRTNNFTGYGIYSLDAGYKLIAIPGPTIDRSFFKNFEYGIYASNSETANTIYVNYGKFSSNGKGIALLSVNSAVVLNSIFEIGISTGCPNQGTGITMNSCTGYAIEKNSFTGGTGVPGAIYSGIEITNSGTTYNEIYQNTFLNLNYGNLANQVNGSSNSIPPTGLTYLCNQNTGNKNDFYVANNSRIAQFQRNGSSGAAANTFSNNALYNFYNGGSVKISYSYSSGQAPFTFYNLLLVPTSVTNGCPSHYGDGMGNLAGISSSQKDAKELQFSEGYSAYNNVKALYESLKDGGNTANTVDEIASSIPSEMWELRNNLLNDSPHLSQTSLREAGTKTDVLPESVLFDILAANPDEMRDEEFLDFLKTKDVPLPDYMIELLREVSGNTSYKTLLQEQLNMYDIQKSTAADDILRSELNDSILNQSSVLNWLDNKGDLASQYQMVDLWLQKGNTTVAQAILVTIPGLFQLSESEIADYQNFNTVKTIQFNLRNSGRNILMLDSTEIASLTNIANSGKGIASAQAKGILGFAIGNQYCQCTLNEEGLKHSEVIPKVNASTSTNIELTVSPNPATTWIAFDYTLPDTYPLVNLSIYDNNGRLIDNVLLTGKQGQKVLNTSSYASGSYVYKCDQIKKISGKFIIK